MCQGNLVEQAKDIDEKDKGEWGKVDWKSRDSKSMSLSRPFQIFFLIWDEARGL